MTNVEVLKGFDLTAPPHGMPWNAITNAQAALFSQCVETCNRMKMFANQATRSTGSALFARGITSSSSPVRRYIAHGRLCLWLGRRDGTSWQRMTAPHVLSICRCAQHTTTKKSCNWRYFSLWPGNITAVFTYKRIGEQLAGLLDKGYVVTTNIWEGQTITKQYQNMNRWATRLPPPPRLEFPSVCQW